MLAAAPAVLVKLKTAGAATPGTVAFTRYDPAVALAVNVGAVALPFTSVMAVLTPPAKVPLAPPAGATNVTVTPETGLLPLSLTVTVKAANAVFTGTLCVAPAEMMTVDAEPALLVSEKFAAAATPVTLAATM